MVAIEALEPRVLLSADLAPAIMPSWQPRRPQRAAMQSDAGPWVQRMEFRSHSIGEPMRYSARGRDGRLSLRHIVDADWEPGASADMSYPTHDRSVGASVSFTFWPSRDLPAMGVEAYQWEQAASADGVHWVGDGLDYDGDGDVEPGMIEPFETYQPEVPSTTVYHMGDYPEIFNRWHLPIRPSQSHLRFESILRATRGRRRGEAIATVAWDMQWLPRSSLIVLYVSATVGGRLSGVGTWA